MPGLAQLSDLGEAHTSTFYTFVRYSVSVRLAISNPLKLDLRVLRCTASTVDFRQRGSFPATAAAAAPAPAAPSGALLGPWGFSRGNVDRKLEPRRTSLQQAQPRCHAGHADASGAVPENPVSDQTRAGSSGCVGLIGAGHESSHQLAKQGC